MELTVIIPVFRETAAICKTLTHLLSLKIDRSFEVIVVDGDPEKTTIRYLESSPLIRLSSGPGGLPVRLISSGKGRGVQMNAGADAARGSLFFFLHADTCPDQGGVDQMIGAWQARPSSLFCGAFDLAIDSPRPWFRVIEKTASLRSRLTRIPYGDQGIFMSRTLFDDIGGFPPVPLMEDVGIMAKVKKKKISPLFLTRVIHTSARRWEARGIIRTTLENWVLISLYILGVSPHRLARFY